MAGALAGGAITTALSWQWVFLINVPIGAADHGGHDLAGRHPNPPAEPLDFAGAVTGPPGWTSLRVLGPVEAAGLGVAIALVSLLLPRRRPAD